MFMGTKSTSLNDVEAMGDHDPIVPEISYANIRLPYSILYKNIFVPWLEIAMGGQPGCYRNLFFCYG